MIKEIKMNVELHDYTNVPEEERRLFLMEITVNGDSVCWVGDDFWVVDLYKLTPYEGMETSYLFFLKEQMNKVYDAYKSLSDEEYEILKKAKEIKDRFHKQAELVQEITDADIAAANIAAANIEPISDAFC